MSQYEQEFRASNEKYHPFVYHYTYSKVGDHEEADNVISTETNVKVLQFHALKHAANTDLQHTNTLTKQAKQEVEKHL